MSNSKLQLAKKKVKAIKHWYILIAFSILGTICMVWLLFYIRSIGTPDNWSLLVLIGPVIWWSLVLFKGFNIYGKQPKYYKTWEESQIKKFMEEEDINTEKYR